MSQHQDQSATVTPVNRDPSDDPRVDAFLDKLGTDFKDNREILVAGQPHRIVLESSFASPNPGFLTQTNLTKAEVRIDFSQFLAANIAPDQSLTAEAFPQLIDQFILERRNASSEMQPLYKKASAEALRDAIFSAGDQFIETFAAPEHSEDMVVKLPPAASPLERFDIPLMSLDHAVEAFIAFNKSEEGQSVQRYARSLTDQALIFSAFRAGQGIKDEPSVVREFLEFAK